MWAGYPAVTLPPPPPPPPAPPPTLPPPQPAHPTVAPLPTIRTQVESLYSVAPIAVSRTQQLSTPTLLPFHHPIRFSQVQTDLPPHHANGLVIGTHIPLSPRNGNIPTSPVFVQIPASISSLPFQRSSLELLQPSGSATVHSVCHEAVNLTFPFPLPFEIATTVLAKNDAPSYFLISPASVPIHFDSCNANFPLASSAYSVIPSHTHGMIDVPDIMSSNLIDAATLNSNAVQSVNGLITAPEHHSLAKIEKVDFENIQCLQQQNNMFATYKIERLATSGMEVPGEYCCPSTSIMDTEEIADRVPLYERIGVQTFDLLETEANDVESYGCYNNVSESVQDATDDDSCCCLPFIHSIYSQDSDATSFYSNTNTESSSFVTQSSPLYSMINNLDDLKRAARGGGAEQLITISIEDCNLPKQSVTDMSVENSESSSLGGLYFCGVSRFDLHAQKSATLKENMEKVLVDMVASGLKFAVLAIRRREENLLPNLSTSYEVI